MTSVITTQSTDGSVVEFSPATREARVRFPVSALFFFLHTHIFIGNVLTMPFMCIYIYHLVSLTHSNSQAVMSAESEGGGGWGWKGCN